MKFFFILIILSPFISKAQGIEWTDNQNWQQVLANAKEQNKLIFIDCFATWCGPCKRMDKLVYQNDTIADFFNKHFISVRLQADTTKYDNVNVQNWYRDAAMILKMHKVTSYPTFLFFLPNGEIVHEEAGFKDVKNFIRIAEDAIDPKKQYFTLINNYVSGNKNYSLLPDLAFAALRYKNVPLANKMASEYIDSVLWLDKSKFLNKKNIQLVSKFTTSSTEPGFWLFYYSTDKVNKIIKTVGYSQGFLINIISREYIDTAIVTSVKENSTPDWSNLSNYIEKRYGNYYSRRCIMEAQIRWFAYKKNWTNYTKTIASLLTDFRKDISNWDLNAFSWQICQHSNKADEIKIASICMKEVVASETDSSNVLPASLDTYANLLYKLGNKKKAISIEEKALNLSVTYNVTNFIKDFKDTLNKMRKNETTF